MRIRSVRFFNIIAAASLIFCFCWLDADAQTRKRRPRRKRPVVTNPTIAAPGQETNEPRIISTVDETGTEVTESQDTTATENPAPKKPNDQEKMEQTINTLSNQVERLNDKLTQMQEDDRTLLDMERLTRAEQRAENLRTQLIDVETKLADLQSKLDQIVYSLKPENIERATAGYGSLRPEEARDTRRRQLENEKNRTDSQVRILEQSKTRLEQSLVLADAEVDRLRRKLEQRDQQEAAGQIESESRPAKTRPRP
jgi:DNA repair exonuclease SbcCD ATPase subunit